MKILGINSGGIGHDAAAALIIDGKTIAVAEEERFIREKHTYKFPEQAIRYCLNEASIKYEDLDYIGFYFARDFMLKKRLLSVLPYKEKKDWEKYIRTFLKVSNYCRYEITAAFRERFGDTPEEKFVFVPHHLAHAASAYYLSGFDESAIFTIDGYGEWDSALLGYGRGPKMNVYKQIGLPTSLGVLYTTITVLLGFEPNEGEYKVMGLAPYGEPKYSRIFDSFVKYNKDGTHEIDPRFYTQYFLETQEFAPFLVDIFGKPRKKDEPLTQNHKDIAASLQYITEEIFLHSARQLKKLTNSNNICMAGGVALNSCANGKIARDKIFKNIFIQPASNDAGCSLGSALYIHYTKNEITDYKPVKMEHAYTGPVYDEKRILDDLAKFVDIVEYEKFDNIEEKTAELLTYENIIGWYQGKMEFGPRALGNRSILADARVEAMVDRVNLAVKKREPFRPFAPSCLKEYAKDYFQMYELEESPFMLFVFPVLEDKKGIIPAVTHVDGTARIQTVDKNVNPKYWNMINEFYKRTGVPVILNTSFNVKGEPIVCTPEDAIKCYLNTEMNYLVLGDYLVKRKVAI